MPKKVTDFRLIERLQETDWGKALVYFLLTTLGIVAAFVALFALNP